ncbi:MAG TPA: hypothetical protein VHO66_06915 [Ruminiclostridium sp.]|nr:hypothetical protein [Ruminiclostridium sp.]
MLLSLLTGVISGILLIYETFYRVIRKSKFKSLKTHVACGTILFAAIIIHITPEFSGITLSSGWLLLLFSLFTIISGILLRLKLKSKPIRRIHQISAALSVTTLLLHAVTKIMYLLLV